MSRNERNETRIPPTRGSLGIEREGFPDAREAEAVPYACGEVMSAPVWITAVLKQRAVKAPNDRPAKK